MNYETNNFETIPISQDDVVIWKFSTGLDLDTVINLYKNIANQFPYNTIIMIPNNTSIDVLDKETAIKFFKCGLELLEEESNNDGNI